MRQFVLDVLPAAELRRVLVSVDTLVAARQIIVEGRPAVAKRRNLASVLSLQVAVVAHIVANGWNCRGHSIPLVKRDPLYVLLAGKHALGFLNS